MKLLIVKLGSIGDVVHTLPTLAALHTALPNAGISWVVESPASVLLRDNPFLEQVIEADTKALRRGTTMSGETLLTPRQQFHQLRASSFDLAIDFQGLLKSALIARLSGARTVVGFARAGLREPASRFLLSKTVQVPLGAHVIVKNLSLAAAALNLDLPTAAQAFEFPIATSQADVAAAEMVMPKHGQRFALLNPGGGWPTKLWPAVNFGQLADALMEREGLLSLVTFGPGEERLAHEVAAASKSNAATAINLPLKAYFELAKRAAVYVGGDTGPTHLAVAARTPVVGLFGPTEWWRNGSPNPDDICVERNEIDCRTDCHRRACANWICMQIPVEKVAQAVRSRLITARRTLDKEILTIA